MNYKPIYFYEFRDIDTYVKELNTTVRPKLSAEKQEVFDEDIQGLKDEMYWCCRADMMDFEDTVQEYLQGIRAMVRNMRIKYGS